ncbi:MAG: peptidylprolyl isomerase [Chitinophagaceae bacterium]|nr:peptidylprolyl isomerase [Chitinophagaceae bacterium]
MNKKWLALIAISLFGLQASSQTLFTYGKYAVDAGEFMRAYNKNNAQPATSKEAGIREYLNLYINSRLKIRHAYDKGFDTLPNVKNEVVAFRSQVIDNYMTDPEILKRLTTEAFDRSQKDIHVAHIFISFRNPEGRADSAETSRKLAAVLARLKKGEDFEKVAEESSEDPSAKYNRGDIGYITVFTLPYEMENLVYGTPVNSYSTVLKSKTGYHIFKNLGERKAVGKIKAQQILLAIPPNADESTKANLGRLADSLYKRLQAGDPFGKMANEFSNDYISAVNGGTMPDISVGQYDPVFEQHLWGLPKDGAFSTPFQTSHGWHIVKRISLKPVVTTAGDANNEEELQQRITTDGRWKTSKEYVYQKVKLKPGFRRGKLPADQLFAYTDSVLDAKPAGVGRNIKGSDVVFNIGDSAYRVSDWIFYSQAYRYKSDGSGIKPYADLLDEYSNVAMYNYYHDHLEEYNPVFRSQMNEFAEGNLIFEVMQEEIWNKDQSDTLALKALYEKNKAKYTWKESADGVIFFCADKAIASTIYDEIKKNPLSWRSVQDKYSEKLIADSARYEWTQFPNLNNAAPTAGQITNPLVNDNDNTASFAWIAKVYPDPAPRSFAEARSQVVNDYQAVIESKLIEELKKKYPVKVNEKVLATLIK